MGGTNRWTTWSCYTRTVTVRNTAVEWERSKPRPARGVREGLSCVPGNWHAQFLGGGRPAMASCYPTGATRRRMSFFPDMGCESLVAAGNHVRAVGWLHPDHPYTQGEVSAEF